MQSAQDPGKSERLANGRDKPRLFRAGAIIAGAILTAILLAFALAPGTSTSSDSRLTPVMASDLDSAAASLNPAQAAQRIADAKTCKAPLATLTIVKRAGAPDSTIRVSSGDYVSPPFKVTDTPQRVAIPYPAPYPTGKGVISVLGEGSDLSIWVAPVWTIPQLNGTASLNVWWNTDQPCPGT